MSKFSPIIPAAQTITGLAIVGLLAACGAADRADRVESRPFTVLLGAALFDPVSDRLAYAGVADGDPVPLSYGLQGGAHVWFAVRLHPTRELGPDDEFELLVVAAVDGAEVTSAGFVVRESDLLPVTGPKGEHHLETAPFVVAFDDPQVVDTRPVDFRLRVRFDGSSASDGSTLVPRSDVSLGVPAVTGDAEPVPIEDPEEPLFRAEQLEGAGCGNLGIAALGPGGQPTLVSVTKTSIEVFAVVDGAWVRTTTGFPGEFVDDDQPFAVGGDLTGDALLDIVVARGSHIRMFSGDGEGRFEERPNAVTVPLEPADVDDLAPGGLALLDIEPDGDLDLFVARTDHEAAREFLVDACDVLDGGNVGIGSRHRDYTGASNMMFVNRDGRLEPFESGVEGGFMSLCALATDFDADGLTDLVVCNDAARQRIYRNSGGGRFEDLSGALGPNLWGHGMGAALGDFDQDGREDIVISDIGAPLFLRLGELAVEVVRPAGVFLSADLVQWGVVAVDVDNDGDDDLVASNFVADDHAEFFGECTFSDDLVAPFPALVVYRNVGPGQFRPEYVFPRDHAARWLTDSIMVADEDYVYSLVAGDLDGDHRVDLAFNAPDCSGPVVLLSQSDRASLSVRGPIGARFEVCTAAGRCQTKSVYSGGSFQSFTPRVRHFGLGDEQTARVRVRAHGNDWVDLGEHPVGSSVVWPQ